MFKTCSYIQKKTPNPRNTFKKKCYTKTTKITTIYFKKYKQNENTINIFQNKNDQRFMLIFITLFIIYIFRIFSIHQNYRTCCRTSCRTPLRKPLRRLYEEHLCRGGTRSACHYHRSVVKVFAELFDKMGYPLPPLPPFSKQR